MREHFNYDRVKVDHPILKSISRVTWLAPAEELMLGYCNSYITYNLGKGMIIYPDGEELQLPKVHIHPPRYEYLRFGMPAGDSMVILSLEPAACFKLSMNNSVLGKRGLFEISQNYRSCLKDNIYGFLNNERDFDKIHDYIIEQFNLLFNQANLTNSLDVQGSVFDDLIEFIIQNHGKVTIKEILTSFPFSRSSLQRKFKAIIGISPDLYIRLVKFTFAVKALTVDQNAIGKVVEDFYYYDFSHLVKDFRKFGGISPKEFRSPTHVLLQKALKDFHSGSDFK